MIDNQETFQVGRYTLSSLKNPTGKSNLMISDADGAMQILPEELEELIDKLWDDF